MNRFARIPALMLSLTLFASVAVAESIDILHLVQHGTTRQLVVDGKPFLSTISLILHSSVL